MIGIGYVSSLYSLLCQLISYMIHWDMLIILLGLEWWWTYWLISVLLVATSSLGYLAPHCPNSIVHSFFVTLLTHITTRIKSTWSSCAYCILVVENLSLVKPMADCIIAMTLEWTYVIIQTHEWECFTLPKVRLYRFIWLKSIPCACMPCFVVLWGWSSLILSL